LERNTLVSGFPIPYNQVGDVISDESRSLLMLYIVAYCRIQWTA